MDDVIKEAASQNRAKKGRPREWGKYQDMISAMYPEVKSQRGKADLCYRLSALKALGGGENPEFNWLLDKSAGQMKSSILTELGRISNPSDMIEVAKYICDQKPNVKEAVRWIKSYRANTGEFKRIKETASVNGLSDAIRAGVNEALREYERNHSGITSEMVRDAFSLFKSTTEVHND